MHPCALTIHPTLICSNRAKLMSAAQRGIAMFSVSNPENDLHPHSANTSRAQSFGLLTWLGRRTCPVFALEQFHFVPLHLLVGNEAQEVRDTVEARPLL